MLIALLIGVTLTVLLTKWSADLAEHATATFWYVLPSLPMFLLIPMLLKRGVGFWQLWRRDAR